MKAFSLASFSTDSPKLITSTATAFFFSFFPKDTSTASSAAMGDPTNSTMRCRWAWFCRCFSANCAFCIAATTSAVPVGETLRRHVRILPESCVEVIRIRDDVPAVVSTPTVFSGFACSLIVANRLAASCCASRRDGGKSPLRIHSELSTHTMVDSSTMTGRATCAG